MRKPLSARPDSPGYPHERAVALTWMARLASGVLSALLTLAPAPVAAQLNPGAQREISGLLQAVGQSGCHFIRSGTTHAADKAQDHLSKKYEYMAARNQLASAEDFIEKAASRSSMSGEHYVIRCGDAAPQRCDHWLRAKLKAMRQPPPT